ncbi:MAG: aldo/keto reductase [Acidimicrobiales bacterium]|nr:aldo/keto reductase [Acidimicrobiales bacterium]
MKYVEVNGVRLSAIGVGCWQFGSREWGYGGEYAHKTAIDIVRRALDLGVNLIDTAEIYAMGASERIVGRAIEGRRVEAFVATKLFPVMPVKPVVEWRAKASRQRLGIDTIDLYQIHWPNPFVPFKTTMQGLRSLQDEGVIKHAGVSNFSAAQWETAERHLGRPVLSNQVQYSLVARRPDREIVPYAQRNDRIVIAYSPLGQGLLGGRYDKDNLPSGSARRMNALFLPENLEKAHPLLNALREIGRAHDATPAQVALAWVIHHPNVVAIPGASSVEQLERNVAAADLKLSADEIDRLTSESDRFRPKAGLAAVPDLVRTRFS